MKEIVSQFPPDVLFMVFAVATLVFTVGLVALAFRIISAVQRHREREMVRREREMAASMVAHMLDREIAPQDIVDVLKAMGLETPPGLGSGSPGRKALGTSTERPQA